MLLSWCALTNNAHPATPSSSSCALPVQASVCRASRRRASIWCYLQNKTQLSCTPLTRHAVQQQLHASVLEGGPHEHGHKLEGQHGAADGRCWQGRRGEMLTGRCSSAACTLHALQHVATMGAAPHEARGPAMQHRGQQARKCAAVSGQQDRKCRSMPVRLTGGWPPAACRRRWALPAQSAPPAARRPEQGHG